MNRPAAIGYDSSISRSRCLVGSQDRDPNTIRLFFIRCYTISQIHDVGPNCCESGYSWLDSAAQERFAPHWKLGVRSNSVSHCAGRRQQQISRYSWRYALWSLHLHRRKDSRSTMLMLEPMSFPCCSLSLHQNAIPDNLNFGPSLVNDLQPIT